MPERMNFEFVPGPEPLVGYIETNLELIDGAAEHYADMAAAAEGSFVAQLLSGVEGVRAFTLESKRMVLERDPDESTDWDSIALQIIGILREEFL